jgi:hypothetical protein
VEKKIKERLDNWRKQKQAASQKAGNWYIG